MFKILYQNMHGDFIEDVDELEFGDEISIIDSHGIVRNLTVKSTEGDTIDFMDGQVWEDVDKEKLQKHIDNSKNSDKIGVQYRA